ncbi:YcxB family protein [Paractinoplanes lichenicola]|uniref:YcxB family protein n=1 Tax=Paractinoplanes lichenicola TaxID=2802976 RepID=A0ABS1W1Z1_9ACTN|nr:YcxB family protein [Actinoplanes lichenicola]MBL7260756.1 YcxB family protein [Actinoplanes lichenicola]
MFLQITAHRDPHLAAAAARHETRRPVMLARIGGWALLGLAVLLQWNGNGLNYTLLLAGVALAVVVPMFLINQGARRAIRDGASATFEISDGGLTSSTPESRHAYAWNAFRHVDFLAGQLVFSLGGSRSIQVPTRGLSPQQINEVLNTAVAHGVPVR